MRGQDAVPDEIEVLPESAEGAQTKDTSPVGSQDRPLTPGDSSIPRTMVEKVDPESPSHGEVPGTGAYEKRQADAVPDLVKAADDLDDAQPPSSVDDGSPETNIPDQEIPETKVSQVETMSTEEELPSYPKAHQSSPSDAVPDIVETVPDVSTPEEPLSQDTAEEGDEDKEAGDEFDEFVEEQDDMGDDDFGDFDDGFQEPGDDLAEEASMGDSMTPQQPLAPPSVVSASIYYIFFTAANTVSLLLPTSTPSNPPPNFSQPSRAPSTTFFPPLKTSTPSHQSSQSRTHLQSSAQSARSPSGLSSSPHHPSNHRTGSSPAFADCSLSH